MGLKNTVETATPRRETGRTAFARGRDNPAGSPPFLPDMPTGKIKDYKYYDDMSRGSRQPAFPDNRQKK